MILRSRGDRRLHRLAIVMGENDVQHVTVLEGGLPRRDEALAEPGEEGDPGPCLLQRVDRSPDPFSPWPDPFPLSHRRRRGEKLPLPRPMARFPERLL